MVKARMRRNFFKKTWLKTKQLIWKSIDKMMDKNLDVNMDSDSEGSDIEVEDFDDYEDIIDLIDGLDVNEVDEIDGAWLHPLFDSDSDNYANFEGFKYNYVRGNLSPRLHPGFKLIEEYWPSDDVDFKILTKLVMIQFKDFQD